jgi:hypothetical protein
MLGMVFFWGKKIHQNFDLKNMVMAYAKDFRWKKNGSDFARFLC